VFSSSGKYSVIKLQHAARARQVAAGGTCVAKDALGELVMADSGFVVAGPPRIHAGPPFIPSQYAVPIHSVTVLMTVCLIAHVFLWIQKSPRKL
jgi:hypothetical protein